MAKELRKRYAQIYRSLGRAELQRNPPEEALDLNSIFEVKQGYWLGFYTADGLTHALERYGFWERLRRLGYESFRIELNTQEAHEHIFRLMSDVPKIPEPLVEVVAHQSRLNLSRELLEQLDVSHWSILAIEWLLLQHPLRRFDPTQSPLPGQNAPGLGMGRDVFELLRNSCKRLKLDGMVVVPSYPHNALFYSDYFNYCDPHYAGMFDALRRDFLEGKKGAQLRRAVLHLTWGVRWGMIMHEHDTLTTAFDWFHEPMVSATSAKSRDLFQGAWYTQERARAGSEHSFATDHELLSERLREAGIAPYDEQRFETWRQKNEAQPTQG